MKQIKNLTRELPIIELLQSKETQKLDSICTELQGKGTHAEIKNSLKELLLSGLIGIGSKGYFLRKAFARFPRFIDSLPLIDVPAAGAKVESVCSISSEEVERNLRLTLGQFWTTTIEGMSFISLPFYVANSAQGDLLAFVAFCRSRRFEAIQKAQTPFNLLTCRNEDPFGAKQCRQQ
jgi:hypothetical protein